MATTTFPRYIDATEAAKMMRKRLKKKFPGVKFSVRTSKYSGGASIRVAWQDGPTQKSVDEVVKAYSGAGFDGMIDMEYPKSSYLLEDGFTAIVGNCQGTGGSRGSVTGYQYEGAAVGMEEVRFGSKYVFTERNFSAEFMERVADQLAEQEGIDRDRITVKVFDGGYAQLRLQDDDAFQTFAQEGRRLACKLAA